MAKTKLLGKEKERQLAEQKKLAKKKNKKQRRSPIRFFKDVWGEVKKVTWPTKKDLFKTTFAVIIFIAIFGVIVWLMNLGFGALFQNFLTS